MGLKHLLLAVAIGISAWSVAGLTRPQAPASHKVVFQVQCPICGTPLPSKLHVVAQPYAVVVHEAG